MSFSLGSVVREFFFLFFFWGGAVMTSCFFHIYCASTLRFVHLTDQLSLPVYGIPFVVNDFLLKMCLEFDM